MKAYLLITTLCLSSLLSYGQKLELEKASPFTAVKWIDEEPVVQFEKNWYNFEALEHFSKKELLDFCKTRFGDKWQKRFSEDLVDVLKGMGYQPNVEVTLQLSKAGVSKRYTGKFTFKNRQDSLQYNKNAENSAWPEKLTKIQALADVKQFEAILDTESSYARLSKYNYKKALNALAIAIKSAIDSIDVNELTNQLSKIMSEIGDRHSSIKNEAFQSSRHKTYNLKLPFAVTNLNGNIIAIKQNPGANTYTYYQPSHSFIKSIDGVVIDTLINAYNYRDKKAPAATKLSRGSRAIQNYGALLFKNSMHSHDSVNVVFTNGSTNISQQVALTTTQNGYMPVLQKANNRVNAQVQYGNFDQLSNLLDHNIGYLHIPKMYDYGDVAGLETYIEQTLDRFLNSKALIIDVRNNPGGVRDILQTLAPYIVPIVQSPWVANVAYMRSDTNLQTDAPSMSARYLHTYHSETFTETDRHAIDQFHQHFKSQKPFDRSMFSCPFYMLLHHGKKSYPNPIYILVNENSFSAASVFTSAFKGLPNVTIVGETSDGSSGNSIKLHLKHSNIRVKVSTMLSFQRNGTTLDGNGTIPDIWISKDESQVLEGLDTQLQRLLEIIAHKD